MTASTKTGIVAIVGKPNVGKSTLLNRLVGQKLAIVSPKAQSTRNRVVGLRSTEATQMVFYDTPGLLDPRYALQRAMRNDAIRALNDADVIVYLVDATEGAPEPLERSATLDTTPRGAQILAANKVDLVSPAQSAALKKGTQAVLLSARSGKGMRELLAKIEERLPEGPFLFPADEASSQSVRFFVLELLRETAFELLSDELPYSVAGEIEEFRESTDPQYIRATLYVERESQQGILVGAGGRTIRTLGTRARKKIEELVGARVFLDLRVKVLPNWRRDSDALRRLGFQPMEEGNR